MTTSRGRGKRKGKRKRETREELENALHENEIVNATPATAEPKEVKDRRRNRRRVKRFRLNKAMRELDLGNVIDEGRVETNAGNDAMDQPNDLQDVLMDVHNHVVSPNDFHVDFEEGKQEEDDPDFVIARAAAREDPQLALSLQELRRLKRNEKDRSRRAERSQFQQDAERAHRAVLEAQLRSGKTDERLLDERYRRRQLESDRRGRLTEEQRDEERRRHSVLEAERRGLLTEDEREGGRRRHSVLEADRRERLTEEQQEEARRRHTALEAERLARLTEEQREEIRQRQSQRQTERAENEVEETLEQRRVQRRTKRYKDALANQEQFEVSNVSGKNVVDERHTLSEPDTVCPKCKAWKWPGESSITCCVEGKVMLPPLQPAPPLLRKWYEDAEFRKQIRMYNQVYAFTSLGASFNNRQFERVAEDHSVQGQRGVYTYRIQGAMGHFMGSLLPYTDQATGVATPPKFAQIYVYDPEMQQRVARRQGIFAGLNGVAMLDLEDMMKEFNPFAQQYISMGQRMRAMIEAGESPVDVVFRLRANNYAGPRTHNLPTSPEVAAVMVNNGDAANNRDLLLFPQSGGLLRLFETHAVYDPLQYPLLLPYGELGWTYTDEYANGATYRKKKRMALREHVAFRLYQKKNDQSVLHQGGRLFQQWVVDQRAKCEQEILRWVAVNQKTLRADLYNGVLDAYLNENVAELRENEGLVCEYDRDTETLVHPNPNRRRHFLDRVGQRVVLPASFTGGERYMYEQYQDSMAMVREFGKPDLFMTVTCNPQWSEITETVNKNGPHQTAQDRPDIVARVWQQKLKAVLKDLDDGVFGHQIARIYVVEFQKRGLPHAHILIILADEDKPKTRRDYDNFVSAELPDAVRLPALYDTVMTSMMHGPCGSLHPNSPCMNDGVCSKGFPKPLSEVTQTNQTGYPVYRRRLRPDGVLNYNGKQHNNATVNQWVVPYNPYFSQKYNCHINIEVCSSITAIKYLYKYVYKGSDRTEISAQAVRDDAHESERPRQEPNEIVRYVKARYISPVEACQRLLEYPVQGKTHTVVTLNVHLPGSQFVTYQGTDDPEQVLEQARHTKLTRFFELAEGNEEARRTLYQDIPKLFRWDTKDKVWIRYKNQRRTIGRMVHCSPRDQERFYLRMLLCHRPGPTSYEDLRTVESELCPTFKEAAMRAGYLDSDREWVTCMVESSLFRMPYQLRQLFATILLYSMPADALALWDQFYDELSRDYEYKYRALTNKDEMVKFKTLESLHEFLMAGGRALAEFSELPQLSEFPHLIRESLLENNLIRRELEGYDREELHQIVDNVSILNNNQREIYDQIVGAVEGYSASEKLFFIDGPGGTGKSTLLNHVLAKLRLQGKIVIAVASSGIASLLLPGGRTAHSTFKIPLKLTNISTCYIPKQSKLKALIKEASLIVWDEAPMTDRLAFEAVDRTLQDVLDNPDESFGGKVVVLSGDFRQILPVVKKGTPADTVAACLKSSDLWPRFKQVRLTVNMRVLCAANQETAVELGAFSAFLLKVGEGRHEVDDDLGADYMKFPSDMLIQNPVYDHVLDETDDGNQIPIAQGLKKIVDAMYSDRDLNDPAVATDDYFAGRTILTPTNAAVQRVNEAVAGRLSGIPHVYLSTDAIEDDERAASAFFETEVLHSININGIPPHKLILKKGVPVMMMRNLNPDAGLCNGTRLRVVELKSHVIRATIMTGAHNGKDVLIPRIIFISDHDNKNFPFRLRRKQFPIVPAFAMTINKAQGQTVHNMGLYLPTPCFSHGQLYVALSRVTSRSKIKAVIENPEQAEEDGLYTKNIVYRQIFD